MKKEIKEITFERKNIVWCYVSTGYDEYVSLVLDLQNYPFMDDEESIATYRGNKHLVVRTYPSALTDLVVNTRKKKFRAYKKRSINGGKKSLFYWMHINPPN